MRERQRERKVERKRARERERQKVDVRKCFHASPYVLKESTNQVQENIWRGGAYFHTEITFIIKTGNTQRGKYHCTIDLLFDWFGISCKKLTIFVFICKTDYSKPVKQVVNGTVILPPFSIH
jgi:hypothetical protein